MNKHIKVWVIAAAALLSISALFADSTAKNGKVKFLPFLYIEKNITSTNTRITNDSREEITFKPVNTAAAGLTLQGANVFTSVSFTVPWIQNESKFLPGFDVNAGFRLKNFYVYAGKFFSLEKQNEGDKIQLTSPFYAGIKFIHHIKNLGLGYGFQFSRGKFSALFSEFDYWGNRLEYYEWLNYNSYALLAKLSYDKYKWVRPFVSFSIEKLSVMDELSFNVGVGIVFGKKEPAAEALSRIVVNPPLTPPGPVVKAPNIYLYPTETCNVKVTVEPNGQMVASSPFYNDGWKVRAYPDGSIPNTPGYLFYEAVVTVEKPAEGWCISSTEVGPFFKNILEAYGLNDVEIRDFLDYWQIRLNRSPYYAVYPIAKETLDDVCPLNIEPAPDAVFRLWFYITPVPEKLSLEKPLVQPFERKGFTVVEWGGILESG